MGYRNCVYDSREQCVHLFTWDEDGNRIKVEASYNPYLYIESAKGDALSIFNTKLTKKTFRNSFELNKFIKDSGIKRVFENLPPNQHFLLDMYWKDFEKPDFANNPLKMCYIDIETYSVKEFPNPENPTHVVNVITCYDTLSKQFHTFGLKEYTGSNKDINYYHCKSEGELFIKFIEYLEKDYPDILSGWNSEFFDIPYIINRCTLILGEQYTKRLSPLGRVHFRDVMGKFGQPQRRYYIDGMAVLDYLDIYRRFCSKLRESYKLDNIAEVELGQNKVDFGDRTLYELADNEWDTFIDYNIQDVNIIVNLEEKLQYLSLLRMLSYTGLCTLEQAMGTLSVINGALCVKAREQDKVVSTFVRHAEEGINPGAYVGEPLKGFQEHIVSFDANSLYPNVMISLNLSPETKIGKLVKKDDSNYLIEHVSGKNFELPPDKFLEFLKKEEISITKANFLFTQKFKGIVPLFVDYYYNKRVEVKEEHRQQKIKLTTLEKDSKEYKKLNEYIERLNAKQICIKILINATYGYFGNKHAPIGDDDIASSVTLTGQAVIKQSNVLLKKYFTEKIPDISEKDLNNVVIYNDTDSSYVSITPFIKYKNLTFTENGNITKETHAIVNDIEKYLNVEIKKWGAKALNSKDCRFVFKRESIAGIGIFLQKKRYVLNVLDDEGFVCNKFKYVGVEVVRTTMPKAIKPFAKKIIEMMLSTKSVKETNKLLNECYDIFKGLSLADISFVMGIKGYEKYAPKCKDFNTVKGMPIHVKSAYFYNLMLKKLGIGDKYETLSSGDKVRYVYLQTPNKYGIKSIGFKHFYPKEFESVFKPDYDMMFNKVLFSMVDRFYDNLNWTARKPSENVQCELFDLFS